LILGFQPIKRATQSFSIYSKFKTISNVSDKGFWLPSSVNLKDNGINLISNRIKYFFS